MQYNYTIINKAMTHRKIMKEVNKMKKILATLLALILVCASVLTVVSCASDEDAKLYAAYNKIIKQYEYDDENAPVLKVAMSPDFAPMEFVDTSKTGDDKYVGFDVILAKYLAKELGMKLQIVPMSFDACMAAAQTGTVDLAISGFSWTADRAENFLISDYYIAGENESDQILITTKENAGKLTNAEALAGMKIGAQGGSLQELLVKEQLPDNEILLYSGLNEAVEALVTGKIAALAVAKGNGEAFISANEDKLDFAGFNFEVEEKYKNNVILLNKNDAELLTKVNAALAKAMDAKVYDSWYEACQILSGIKTIDELGYDDQGNKIEE